MDVKREIMPADPFESEIAAYERNVLADGGGGAVDVPELAVD